MQRRASPVPAVNNLKSPIVSSTFANVLSSKESSPMSPACASRALHIPHSKCQNDRQNVSPNICTKFCCCLKHNHPLNRVGDIHTEEISEPTSLNPSTETRISIVEMKPETN